MSEAIFGLIKLVLFLLSPFLVSAVIIIMMAIGFIVHYRLIRKMKIPVSTIPREKKAGFFKKLYIQFPHRWVDDLFHRNPDEFTGMGLHMVCGEQGSGKTISVVHMLQDYKRQFPLLKIRTNMNYKHEDGEINHWKQLVQNENGEFGQIEVLDEIQTWFSSLQSKDFPPEMITEISQQRKQRKMIIGTAQVFSRIAKPIREQTSFVYLPRTFMGCLTIVRVSKPKFWDDEKQTFKQFIKTYFFVHTKEIRDAFDTYKKIEKYTNEGFKEDKDRAVLHQVV